MQSTGGLDELVQKTLCVGTCRHPLSTQLSNSLFQPMAFNRGRKCYPSLLCFVRLPGSPATRLSSPS